jgi:hypothetical protein
MWNGPGTLLPEKIGTLQRAPAGDEINIRGLSLAIYTKEEIKNG